MLQVAAGLCCIYVLSMCYAASDGACSRLLVCKGPYLLSTSTPRSLNGVHIRCQVAINDVPLLHTIFQVVAVPVDIESNVAMQGDTVGAVDGDAAPVGAA